MGLSVVLVHRQCIGESDRSVAIAVRMFEVDRADKPSVEIGSGLCGPAQCSAGTYRTSLAEGHPDIKDVAVIANQVVVGITRPHIADHGTGRIGPAGVTAEVDTTIARVEGRTTINGHILNQGVGNTDLARCFGEYRNRVAFEEDRESGCSIADQLGEVNVTTQIRGLAGVVQEDGVADDISAHGEVVEENRLPDGITGQLRIHVHVLVGGELFADETIEEEAGADVEYGDVAERAGGSEIKAQAAVNRHYPPHHHVGLT